MAQKKSNSWLKNTVAKAGGAEGVLDSVSKGAGKAAEIIRTKKGAAVDDGGVAFDAGARDDNKQDPTLFGMPQVMAYTIIGVLFVLILFIVFKVASKQ